MKRELVYFRHRTPEKLVSRKGWSWREEVRGPVRVMTRAEGYVMVRFPQAMPFVISEKDIVEDNPAHPKG